ncbi:hypothetical protein ACSBR2_034038 [Camellia fascicularis]
MNLSGLSISFSLPPSLSSLDLTLSLCLALSILCFLSLMFFSDQQLCYVDILYPLQERGKGNSRALVWLTH